ncbi:MAG: alpha/beta fold hydrolase [Isosphaeraceae bacterium]|nr:alpha/beta fold hydrolase [Isosphaeraceae bacterium]
MLKPLTIISNGSRLRGILHEPEEADPDAPCVLFMAGPATTRGGPHRVHFVLATALEQHGVRSIRFDYRGRGESDGDDAAVSVRTMIEDGIAAQEHALGLFPESHLVLVANCLGCVAALRVLEESRTAVAGVLLGATHFGETQGTKTRLREFGHGLRIYLGKLRRPDTWRKLLRLDVDWHRVAGALLGHSARKYRPVAQASRPGAYGLRPSRFPGKTAAFVWGADDPSLSERGFYARYCAGHRWHFREVVVEECDRSFSRPGAVEQLSSIIGRIVAERAHSPSSLGGWP